MVGFLGLLIVRLLLVSPSRPCSSSVRVSLISDLPVAGRYSASVSYSCHLGHRPCLRLCLRLVLSFSRAFRSPWGFVVSLRSATTVAWCHHRLCLPRLPRLPRYPHHPGHPGHHVLPRLPLLTHPVPWSSWVAQRCPHYRMCG